MFDSRLEAVLADRPCSFAQIKFGPRRLRHFAVTRAGEQERLSYRSVGIAELLAGAPERPDLVISQSARARPFLADEGLRFQPVGRRQCDSIDLALDCPAEQPLDGTQRSMRRVLAARSDRLQEQNDIDRGDVSDGTAIPRRQQIASDDSLDLEATPLTRAFLSDEVFGYGAKCGCGLAPLGHALPLLLNLRIDAAVDQIEPMPGLVAGLLKRELAVGSEHPARRVFGAGKARR